MSRGQHGPTPSYSDSAAESVNCLCAFHGCHSLPPFLLADLPDVDAPLYPTHPKADPEEVVFPFFCLKLYQLDILDVPRWREDMFSRANA